MTPKHCQLCRREFLVSKRFEATQEHCQKCLTQFSRLRANGGSWPPERVDGKYRSKGLEISDAQHYAFREALESMGVGERACLYCATIKAKVDMASLWRCKDCQKRIYRDKSRHYYDIKRSDDKTKVWNHINARHITHYANYFGGQFSS